MELGKPVGDELVGAILASDPAAATALFTSAIRCGESPWELHLELFPVAQRILNPPFINPHFPKLHGICRELAADLEQEDLARLVEVEVGEFALRPKLSLPEKPTPAEPAAFSEFEAAVARRSPGEAATVLLSLWQREGGRLEAARGLLLLGSGYLQETLGHSVSCTAFILLELLRRPEEEPWPALVALAEYFCRGGFERCPEADGRPDAGGEPRREDVLRAVSGGGIVALHDTITLYAVERFRPLVDEDAHRRLVGAWTAFLREKESRPVRLPGGADGDFEALFRSFDGTRVAAVCRELIRTPEGRTALAAHFVRALAECYRGKVNPHHVTGLGAILWVLDRWSDDPELAETALNQYLEYLLPEVRREVERGWAFRR
ncbi:MAG: hypothetical protein HY900_09580 [Deltaproteobacteria bacterium]|nr:hypothetical protein [Deltaproteobacteria bacterium]